MQNPVRGFLHGSAAVASIVGTAFLVFHAWGNVAHVVGAIIFGVSLVGLYTASALFHSVPWRERTRYWMQRVDHSMIFVLVAGTTTPIAIAALDGGARIAVLAAVVMYEPPHQHEINRVEPAAADEMARLFITLFAGQTECKKIAEKRDGKRHHDTKDTVHYRYNARHRQFDTDQIKVDRTAIGCAHNRSLGFIKTVLIVRPIDFTGYKVVAISLFR